MLSIKKSVGANGNNLQPDVATVQTLLNSCVAQTPPRTARPVTGFCDLITIDWIKDFQIRVVKLKSPDGRVDPGGQTLAALNAIASGQPYLPKPELLPASGPSPKFTESPNEVGTRRTSPSPADVVALLKSNWTELNENGARTLTAQFMHETGGGRFCYNWNLGNVKSSADQMHMYLKGVWEVDTPQQADAQVAKSGGLGKIATPELIKEKGWSCPVGMKVVVFEPPHPQCRFRAYTSLEEGSQKWMGHHRKIASNNPNYLLEVNSGDCTAVAKTLKKVGYYTGGEDDYAKSMVSQKAKIDFVLGPI